MMRFFGILAAALLCSTSASAQEQEEETEGTSFLAVSGWYKDRGIQAEYTRAIGPVIREYGFQSAIIGNPGVNLRVIEGNMTPRTMLFLRFPSEERVKSFWWSDAYAKVREIRLGRAHLDVAQIDALPGAEPIMDDKSAYLVFFTRLTDPQRFFVEYAPNAPAVVAEHDGRFLIRTSRAGIEGLEGDWINASMVLIEFPTIENLRAFWESDEYRRLSQVRKETGEWSVIEIAPMQR